MFFYKRGIYAQGSTLTFVATCALDNQKAIHACWTTYSVCRFFQYLKETEILNEIKNVQCLFCSQYMLPDKEELN